jgi:hypothetical protein
MGGSKAVSESARRAGINVRDPWLQRLTLVIPLLWAGKGYVFALSWALSTPSQGAGFYLGNIAIASIPLAVYLAPVVLILGQCQSTLAWRLVAVGGCALFLVNAAVFVQGTLFGLSWGDHGRQADVVLAAYVALLALWPARRPARTTATPAP